MPLREIGRGDGLLRSAGVNRGKAEAGERPPLGTWVGVAARQMGLTLWVTTVLMAGDEGDCVLMIKNVE